MSLLRNAEQCADSGEVDHLFRSKPINHYGEADH